MTTPTESAAMPEVPAWQDGALFKGIRARILGTAYSNDNPVETSYIIYESELSVLAETLNGLKSIKEECLLTIDRMNADLAQAAKPAPGWLPISTAPRDGMRLLLAKIVGHPEHATALWWACTGSWSTKYSKWWDGVEPCGLAGPTHWMPLILHMQKAEEQK